MGPHGTLRASEPQRPSLPGCISQGRTREEAVANIKEAIDGYVAALKEDGLPVPEERFETLVLAV